MKSQKWRVLLLDTKRSNPNHYIALCVQNALRNNPSVESVTKAEYGNAISRAINAKCNLFFAFDGEEINREICLRLKNICVRSIVWFTEDPYEININRNNADLFDLVFTNDAGSVGAYGKKGRHLPLAASEKYHFHATPEETHDHFRYDLFFAGTAWPNRVSLIREIMSKLQGTRIKFALPCNEHLPAPELPIPKSSYSWRTPNSEFCRMANRSKVVLGLHRSFSSSGDNDTALTPGPRVFEIAMAGAFQLVDNSLPGMSSFFSEGTDYVGFNSPSQCIESLEYYLRNPGERLAIARSAQSKTLSLHTYEERIFLALQELNDVVRRGPTSMQNIETRKKVLIVSHNIIGIQPYGGVEVYQDLIRESISERYDIYFYVPDRSYLLGQRYRLLDSNYLEIEAFSLSGPLDQNLLTCELRERLFSKILVRHDIHLVHFQHLIGHSPSLPFISKALGIPNIISIHDFYSVCQSFNLIGYTGEYCEVEKRSLASCDVCLNATNRGGSGSQGIRRAFFGRMLGQADFIHANSDTTARIIRTVYPIKSLEKKITTFGIPINSETAAVRNLDSLDDGNIRNVNAVILGNFTKIKGADVLIHAFNQMRDEPIIFHIFGNIEPPYDQILISLNMKNIKIYGSYTPGTLQNKLAEMDLALFMSIWPETYCITLSEAWQAGVVPIVSNIGALGERVIDDVNGFKVAAGQPGDLVLLLRELISEPDRIARVRNSIRGNEFTTIPQHKDWLDSIYSNLLTGQRQNTLETVNSSFQGITLSDCGIRLAQMTWLNQNLAGSGVLTIETAPTQSSTSILAIAGMGLSPARALAAKGYLYFRRYGITAAIRRSKSEILKLLKGRNV